MIECQDCWHYEAELSRLEQENEGLKSTLSNAQEKLNDLTNMIFDLYRLTK